MFFKRVLEISTTIETSQDLSQESSKTLVLFKFLPPIVFFFCFKAIIIRQPKQIKNIQR